jgi:cysteine synthase A
MRGEKPVASGLTRPGETIGEWRQLPSPDASLWFRQRFANWRHFQQPCFGGFAHLGSRAREFSAMQSANGIIEAIGNTPLIKLERVSAATGCTILGKAEFMNPGQSVKDRAALFIIEDAVKKGELRPGGVIVEGTAGNTGIGLALVGNAMGFRSVIVIPETQSQEKKDTLRLCGAELVEVPAVPYSNPNNYVKISGRLAAQLAKTEKNGAIWANQFDNVANRQGHIETTGPEIWRQTDGKIDGFVCAVGTGGTLAGVAMALKARNKGVRIALADPMGAALYSYYTTGQLKSEGSSITEGIGQGRITKNLEDAPIDTAYQIPDAEAVPIIFDLLEHEGLCLGGSSGINVAGAVRLARELGPGHTIVTILADYGTRYQSKLFNPAFLREKKLPVPAWLERKSSVKVPYE